MYFRVANAPWVDQRVIIEADGRRYHDTPQAFERDRRRDHELGALGWQVIRITWRQLIERPERILAALRIALA